VFDESVWSQALYINQRWEGVARLPPFVRPHLPRLLPLVARTSDSTLHVGCLKSSTIAIVLLASEQTTKARTQHCPPERATGQETSPSLSVTSLCLFRPATCLATRTSPANFFTSRYVAPTCLWVARLMLVLFVQVEKVLFSIPKRIFNDSAVFSDMYQLPQTPSHPVDGVDLAHPLKLDGIKKTDFQNFLRLFISCVLLSVAFDIALIL
jgi:hypothetical protein